MHRAFSSKITIFHFQGPQINFKNKPCIQLINTTITDISVLVKNILNRITPKLKKNKARLLVKQSTPETIIFVCFPPT